MTSSSSLRVLVTGSAGHLGEALVRELGPAGHEVVGVDVLDSAYTTAVGSAGGHPRCRDRPHARGGPRCRDRLRQVHHQRHYALHPRRGRPALGRSAGLKSLYPNYEAEYARRGWRMFPSLERVYVNARARSELGWAPRYDFGFVLNRLEAHEDPRSPLARSVGSKGYHA